MRIREFVSWRVPLVGLPVSISSLCFPCRSVVVVVVVDIDKFKLLPNEAIRFLRVDNLFRIKDTQGSDYVSSPMTDSSRAFFYQVPMDQY